MNARLENLELIQANITKIRNRVYTLSVFTIDPDTNRAYREEINIKRNIRNACTKIDEPNVILSTVVEESNSPRAIIDLTTLKKKFEELKSYLNKDNFYYVAYDWGYYDEGNNFKNLIILIAYVPDSSPSIQKKFTYSVISRSLIDILSAAKIVAIQSWDLFTYEHITSEVAHHSK